ncbi:MAG: hypothetical protein H7333_12315 [Bdellovibrionales bacterium]|nr:hypothetical protein [Oligoflexia bacterium]
MKAKLQLVSIAMLGVVFSGMLLAGISAHAETNVKAKTTLVAKWDSGRPGGL